MNWKESIGYIIGGSLRGNLRVRLTTNPDEVQEGSFAVIEGDNAPLFQLPSAPISDIDKQVASYIVPLIEDRSCLQIGIGGGWFGRINHVEQG